jgi:hypothetical protein
MLARDSDVDSQKGNEVQWPNLEFAKRVARGPTYSNLYEAMPKSRRMTRATRAATVKSFANSAYVDADVRVS